MNKKEQEEYLSGKHEVELTDQLISSLVKGGLWGDEKSLKEMREIGAKWNTKRKSVVFPLDFI